MVHSGINVLFEGSNFARLMAGLWTSIWIAVISIVLGLALGTIFGILRTLPNKIVRFILRLYLEFFRIVPTIVLLYLVYYILPRTFHVNWSATWMAVLAFTLWVAAEFSDIVGILSGLSAVALKWFINVLGHYFKAGLNPYGPNLHLLCYPLAGILLVSVFQRYVLKKDYSRSTYMLSLAIASGRYRMTKSSILNSVLTCGLTIGLAGDVDRKSVV
ncbi:ABC transporter permease subunit [uncultured Limosilactobacillus sp.]|uniref:ABC transporter permease subunit n=1 Tax=uncultured Limosilactobacillus sp. TaxID=2837629 RepID=UPI00351D5602